MPLRRLLFGKWVGIGYGFVQESTVLRAPALSCQPLLTSQASKATSVLESVLSDSRGFDPGWVTPGQVHRVALGPLPFPSLCLNHPPSQLHPGSSHQLKLCAICEIT